LSNRPGKLSIARWRAETSDLGPAEVLAWAARRFEGRIALASSLGLEDQVLTDMIARADLQIPVFTIDTGRLFPETYELISRMEEHWGVKLRVYSPDSARLEEIVSSHGINLFRESIELRKLCCRVRKVEPLRRALSGLDAWVCGLRRDQGVTRSGIEKVEWDEANGLLKINPLLDWGEARVCDYVKRHEVPVNTLHDQGYPSIGCACCTRAVQSGEDVRAGRWWWETPEKKECGLHQQARSPGA
jgi:phosphoadenosine phosphosulfate reductase